MGCSLTHIICPFILWLHGSWSPEIIHWALIFQDPTGTNGISEPEQSSRIFVGIQKYPAPKIVPLIGSGIDVCTCAQSLQSCLTPCDPMDYCPPGSSVHWIQRDVKNKQTKNKRKIIMNQSFATHF